MSMLSLSLSGTVFSLSSSALTPTRQPHRPLLLDEHLDQPTLSTEAKLGGINFELFVLRQVAAHRQYSHATICAARVRSVQAIAQLPPAKRQMPSRSNRQNSPNLRSFHPIRSAARIAVAGPALTWWRAVLGFKRQPLPGARYVDQDGADLQVWGVLGHLPTLGGVLSALDRRNHSRAPDQNPRYPDTDKMFRPLDIEGCQPLWRR